MRLTYPQEVLRDRPVAYYRLNETSGLVAHDSSGNGHNATIASSGVTYGQAGALLDPSAAAMLFNGTAGCVHLSPGAGVFPSGNAPWSIEAWVNFANVTNTGVVAAFGTGAMGEEPNFYVSSGELYESAWNDDTSVKPVVTGLWYYLLTTWDGSKQRAYVNAVLTATGTPGTLSVPSSPTVAIARNPSPSEYFLHATQQEVAFYGTALPASRVWAHYTAALTLPPRVYPVVTPAGFAYPVIAPPASGGGIVAGGGSLVANAALVATAAQLVAPSAPLAANAIVSAPAQLLAPSDPLTANATLSEPSGAQLLTSNDPLTAQAVLGAVPGAIILNSGAQLAANAAFTATAAQIVAPSAPTVANATLSETGAQIVAQGDALQANALLGTAIVSGGGALGANAGLSASGQIVTPSVPLAANAALTSVPACVLTSTAPVTANALLAETAAHIAAASASLASNAALATPQGAIVVDPSAPLVASALLSASILSGAGTLAANAGLSATAQVVSPAGAATLPANAALSQSAASIVAPPAGTPLAAYSILAEAAQIVATALALAGDIQANAVLAATGHLAGTASTMAAVAIFADGSVVARFADATSVGVFADGGAAITFADGSATARYADGAVTAVYDG